jgi:NAD(P)-dependent dehydrogenase (short-subunit alcohol dehydrogenase family)
MPTPTSPTPLRAVVTGAGRGIGAAIAAKLAAEGAQVVVSDIDPATVADVATAIGGYAVPADATSPAEIEHLLAAATDHLGDIDAYFGNAGIIGGGGLESSDAEWGRTLDVNVMAHVRVARLLMPGWVRRGHGRFVVTASAAGLLSMIGDAPYSVSKHAAVAFAEWLSITYGDKGIVVQALCPQGVQTAMLDAAGDLRDLLASQGALTPQEVADCVWEGLQDDRFLILPHPQVADFYRYRAADTDGWLRGMRKLQSGWEARRGHATTS